MDVVSETDENYNYHVNSQLKHYILQDYLSAWLPIMSSFADSLMYVDCFAGQGTCQFDGAPSDGSPLVALRTINRFLHDSPATVRRPTSISVVLVELNRKACAQLKNSVDQLKRTEPLDPRINCTVLAGDAQSALLTVLGQTPVSVPAFYFIDPNYRLPDMAVIRLLLARPMAEVFVNFMYYQVIRNMSNPKYHNDTALLLGDVSYQAHGFGAEAGGYSWEKVVEFYFQQSRATYYIPFRVRFGKDEYYRLRDVLKYVLIHLSNHFKAFDKMLTAMYSNSESGSSLQVSMNEPTLFPTLELDHLIELVKGQYQRTGTVVSFDVLRKQNWRLYASEKMWRDCLKELKRQGIAVFHHVSSKTDRGITGNDQVEFIRG